MSVLSKTVKFSTKGNCHVIDITEKVEEILKTSRTANGIATIFVPGATGAISTLEYEPGLVKDIKELFDRLTPMDFEYYHNAKWQDGNGHSHVRASLLGPSLTVPFVKEKLCLGTWQQIVFIDFDTRSRDREIIIQILGE